MCKEFNTGSPGERFIQRGQLRYVSGLLISLYDGPPGQYRHTHAKFMVSRVYIFYHWSFFLLLVKIFNKIIKDRSLAFSSNYLINPPAF